MSDLFEAVVNFMSMEPYADRKVDRYEQDNVLVDTCSISDQPEPYETAVAHPQYNAGDLIIVELYHTKKSAKAGHKKWVKIMTTDPLPGELCDVSQERFAKMCDGFEDWRTYKRKE